MPRGMTAWRPAIELLFASQWRGPAIGFFVAASLAGLGRRRRFRHLAAVAAAVGLLAGWLTQLGHAGHDSRRLGIAVIAAAAMLLGGLAMLRAGKRGAARHLPSPLLPPPLLLGLAVLAGAWWLGGAERSLGAIAAAWRGESVTALAAALIGFPLLAGLRAVPPPTHWPLAALSAALAAAFVAIGAGGSTVPLALALAGAVLGAGIGGGQGHWRQGQATAIGVVAALALLAGGAILADGRAMHARPAPVWAAALAPLATLWLFRRLTPRLSGPLARRLGGVALASLLALALVSLLAFSAAAIAGLR